ncbi:MAG: ComEC family competence protein, partial [Planctomycetia bacterium]|nr:ComEC family competence protein [Planctomycetia bacterium]
MVVAAAVAVGSLCGLVIESWVAVWWSASAIAIAAWMMFFRMGWHGWSAVALLAAAAGGAAGWCTVRSSLFAADDLAWSLSESPRPVAVEATVIDPPRRLPAPAGDPGRGDAPPEPHRASSECVVALSAARWDAAWRPASGRAAMIVDGGLPDLAVGTRVRVFGRGLRPSAPLNPDEFDFRRRARMLRCLSIVRVHSAACIDVLARPLAWSPLVWIERLRSDGVQVLRRHLSPEQAPLAAALLLGSRESLPREESVEFLVTGTIHILSISGLHVGFLALAMFAILRLLAVPRGWALVAVVGCTGLYMTLVRAETPVVRATLLVWLACLGAALGRRSSAINALALAAVLVLLWHPPELVRIGTQLSFLSTAVLVGVSAALSRPEADDPIERLVERSRPAWERRLRRIGRQARDGVIAGAAVWVVTAPVVATQFHLVSPVGLVLNPLIAPLVALAMAWGGLCLVASLLPGPLLSSPVAAACGWVCDGSLRGIAWMVEAAAA